MVREIGLYCVVFSGKQHIARWDGGRWWIGGYSYSIHDYEVRCIEPVFPIMK